MTTSAQPLAGASTAWSSWLQDDAGGGSRRSRRVFVATLLVLMAVFGATASWTFATNDPLTNAITGWYLGNEATVVLDRHADVLPYRTTVAWVVESARGPVSQYPPGASAVAALAYALTPGDLQPVVVEFAAGDGVEILQPPIWPSTLTAVLVTALACAILSLMYFDLGGTPSRAVVAGVLSGVATGAWSVASNMSWTHGPAMLCIAVGVWAASRDRWWVSGIAFGAGILVRPHIAVIAAVLGIWLALRRRQVTPVVGIGAGSVVGLALLLVYNRYLFETWTLSAGYGGDFADNLASTDVVWFARNVLLGLASPVNGVLVWAPFLVVLVLMAYRTDSRAPDWTVAAAMGGLAYLLVQWKANRYTGGAAFFAYRYPLEALVACGPWLFWVVRNHQVEHSSLPRAVPLLVMIAITGQAVGAVLS